MGMDISSSDNLWKPRRVIGRVKGIPLTSMPPLGDSWDKRMDLCFELTTSGKNTKIFIGCFKSSSKVGIINNG